MPEINDYSDFNEFKSPALYTITNKSSGTVLDLSGANPAPNTSIIGYQAHDGDNQKWQIADVGESKYVIICRKTGSFVSANVDGGAVLSSVGYPDKKNALWKIQKPDAQNPELTQFLSVAFQGSVLELNNGSEQNSTPVNCYAQNTKRNGQNWLLKKLN